MIEQYAFAWWLFLVIVVGQVCLSFFLMYAGFEEHEPTPGIAGVIYFFVSMLAALALFEVI